MSGMRADQSEASAPAPEFGGPAMLIDLGPVGRGSGTVDWSRDGSSFMVVDAVDGRWWPWFDDHAGELGAVAVIASVLVLGWASIRLLRTPRVAGRRYCRRCNHDLADGAPGEPCPECGCMQSGRELAGPRWRRPAAIAAAAAIMVLSAGGVALLARVQWAPRAVARQLGDAWPVARLGELDWWPLWRVWQRSFDVSRAITVRQDATQGWVAGPVWNAPDARVKLSPDGRWMAALRFDAESGYIPTLEWFDSITGAAGRLELGTNADGFFAVQGFTEDGLIVVSNQGLIIGGPDPATTPETQVTLTVSVVDPRTGDRSIIGTGAATALSSGGSWMLPSIIAAVGDGSLPPWGAISIHQGRADTIRDLNAGRGALVTTGTPPITTMPSISNPTQARLADDGATLEYEGLIWAAGTLRAITRRVDLAGGIVLDAPGQPRPIDPEHGVVLVLSPDGRRASGGAVVNGRWKAIVREFAALVR
jgi:hypothetical protein